MVSPANHSHGSQIVCPAALTQANLANLERQVDDFLIRRPAVVYFVGTAVDSVESAGLEWLLSAATRLAGQEIQVYLRTPSPLLMDLLIATRLAAHFKLELQPTPEAAHA